MRKFLILYLFLFQFSFGQFFDSHEAQNNEELAQFENRDPDMGLDSGESPPADDDIPINQFEFGLLILGILFIIYFTYNEYYKKRQIE